MNKLADILFFVLVFLLQVILTDYLHLGPFVYLCLIPFLILHIPFSRRPQVVLLAAFGMGLALDLLSDGVAGLNAAAAVAAAASRQLLYRTLVNRDRQVLLKFLASTLVSTGLGLLMTLSLQNRR